MSMTCYQSSEGPHRPCTTSVGTATRTLILETALNIGENYHIIVNHSEISGFNYTEDLEPDEFILGSLSGQLKTILEGP